MRIFDIRFCLVGFGQGALINGKITHCGGTDALASQLYFFSTEGAIEISHMQLACTTWRLIQVMVGLHTRKADQRSVARTFGIYTVLYC